MQRKLLISILIACSVAACGPRDPASYCAPEEMTAKAEALARDLEAAYRAKRIGPEARTQAAERLTAAGLDFAKTEDSKRYCGIMDEIRRDLKLSPSPANP